MTLDEKPRLTSLTTELREENGRSDQTDNGEMAGMYDSLCNIT